MTQGSKSGVTWGLTTKGGNNIGIRLWGDMRDDMGGEMGYRRLQKVHALE